MKYILWYTDRFTVDQIAYTEIFEEPSDDDLREIMTRMLHWVKNPKIRVYKSMFGFGKVATVGNRRGKNFRYFTLEGAQYTDPKYDFD